MFTISVVLCHHYLLAMSLSALMHPIRRPLDQPIGDYQNWAPDIKSTALANSETAQQAGIEVLSFWCSTALARLILFTSDNIDSGKQNRPHKTP